MSIEELVNQFETGTLPQPQWTHEAHLKIALYYMYNEKDHFSALTKMRCGLIRYGALRNPQIVCVLRYNETITLFWMYKMHMFVDHNKGKTMLFEDLWNLFLKCPVAEKEYIYKFYDKEDLHSDRSRASWTSPTDNFWSYDDCVMSEPHL